MSILIACPCFGGKLEAEFMQSVLVLIDMFRENNIKYELQFLANESLISRARNSFINKFYETTTFSHLLFLDADLIFNPISILTLIKHNKELIGCPYAKKKYNWKKIINYFKTHEDITEQEILDKGLVHFTDANYNFDKQSSKQGSLFQCKDIPTGCMLIRRSVITALIMKYPERKYINNIAGQSGNYYYDFFATGVVNGIYLSEDYYFCHLCRQAGIKAWLETGYTIGHIGREIFYTNLEEQLKSNKMDNLNSDKLLLKALGAS